MPSRFSEKCLVCISFLFLFPFSVKRQQQNQRVPCCRADNVSSRGFKSLLLHKHNSSCQEQAQISLGSPKSQTGTGYILPDSQRSKISLWGVQGKELFVQNRACPTLLLLPIKSCQVIPSPDSLRNCPGCVLMPLPPSEKELYWAF